MAKKTKKTAADTAAAPSTASEPAITITAPGGGRQTLSIVAEEQAAKGQTAEEETAAVITAPGAGHLTVSIAVERDGQWEWVATSVTSTDLAPLVQPVTSATTYLARTFEDMYPALREEFFATLLQVGKGRFTWGDLDAFCLAIQAQLSRDTEATGRGKLKGSLYLYGRSLDRDEYIPLDLDLRQAVDDAYGITGNSGAAREKRKTLAAVAYALHTTPIAILDSKGTGDGHFLCNLRRFHVDEGIPNALHLSVNEVFANLAAGYGKFPGGIMRRVVTQLGGHGASPDIARALLRLFAFIDRSHPLTISFAKLFAEIGKEKEYKERPQRTIDALQRALDALHEAGEVKVYKRTKTTTTIVLYTDRRR